MEESVSVYYQSGIHPESSKDKVAQLQKDYEQMQQEQLHLQGEIKRLNAERQEFIIKACKERMPDEEFTVSRFWKQYQSFTLTSICCFKNALPGFEKQGSEVWSFTREKSNTRKRAFRNIENFILVFEVSSHI